MRFRKIIPAKMSKTKGNKLSESDFYSLFQKEELQALVRGSRSPRVAERALLSMMFSVEILEVSLVKGKRIKKDEPPRKPLDKDLLERLIGKYALFYNFVLQNTCTIILFETSFDIIYITQATCRYAEIYDALLNYSSLAPSIN